MEMLGEQFRGLLACRGYRPTLRNALQQGVYICRLHNLQELVRCVVLEPHHLAGCVIHGDSPARTEIYNPPLVELLLPGEDKMLFVSEKDEPEDSPEVVVEIGIIEIYAPTAWLRRETSKHQYPGSCREERFERVEFRRRARIYGDLLLHLNYVLQGKVKIFGDFSLSSGIQAGLLHHLIHRLIVTMEEPRLNTHNKDEYAPAHTCEHILNRTMVNMFGCPRSRNSHVERKKSKCDYILDACPADEQVRAIEAKVNEIVNAAMPVAIRFMSREEAAAIVDLSKLPSDASETLRIVSIGDYDDCACIGAHVDNTSEVGAFKIISHDFNDGIWRVRWKVIAE